MDVNQMLLYESMRLTVGPLLKLRLRLRIEGQENVPDDGAALVVCNHRSSFDPLLLAYAVRNRYINFGAAAWSWKVPGYAQFHQWLGAFPVTLSGGNSEKELNPALELLENGEIVGFFPEGGETILDPGKADRIKRFKTGFVRLALQARVPIIPCAVIGLVERRLPSVPAPVVEKFMGEKSEKSYSSVVYRRAMVRIGVPLHLGDLGDKPVNKQLLDLISNKTRQIVMKLYNGEDLERFLTGEIPFDFAYERVGGPTKKLL